MRSSWAPNRLGRGLLSRVRERNTVVLRVQAPQTDAAELKNALEVGLAKIAQLTEALPILAPDLASAKFVAPQIVTPDGTIILIDFGELPPQVRVDALGLLVDALTEAGLRGAVVGLPRDVLTPWFHLNEEGPAVRGYAWTPLGPVYNGAGLQVPDPALVIGTLIRALRGLAPETLPLYGLVISAATELTWPEAEAFAETVRTGGSQSLTLVACDGRERLVALAIDYGHHATAPSAAITSLGGDVDADLELIRTALTDLAPSLTWAALAVSVDAARWTSSSWDDYHRADDVTRSPGRENPLLSDVVVPDAAWWQILGRTQVARLGGPPTGARPLPQGRYELTIGSAHDWLPGAPGRQALVSQGRELLQPLLLGDDQRQELARVRLQRARATHPELFRHRP